MRLIASGDLEVDPFISHVAKPEEANDLYGKILAGTAGWMSIFFDWD
jgi:threonine dehydrogenase-like Zn-dependent dehydrogenase